MKNIPTITKTTLPTVNVAYEVFDIFGNTFGRYFDYKRETKLIEHETQKVKAQAKVMVKQIDTELTKSLDTNNKNFQKEMQRLKVISKDLKGNAKAKSQIMKMIQGYTQQLSDPNMPMELKGMIPHLIQQAGLLLSQENEDAFKKLNLMSHFDSNAKLIGDE